MVAIPFPVTSTPGHVDHAESQGRLINLFAEPLGDRAAKRVRVPGMTSFLTSSETNFRGMILVGSVLYMAFQGELMRGTSLGGIMTSHSTTGMSGTGSVYFARNNAATPQIVMVNENGAFTISGASTIASYPDPDLPQPNSVCMIDGYFVFTLGDGRAFASDLNSTDVNALSFARAEAKPDGLLRAIPFGGRLLMFGNQSIEIWTDVGATPFPFQRAVVVPFGLIGPDAVSGWEDGFGSGLLWVADDFTVRQLNGYEAVKVSPPDLERLIAREASPSTLMAAVYVVDGHSMWNISGSDFTWAYDLGTRQWHERESYLTNRWRGLQTVRAFDRWLVGDRGSVPGEFDDDGNVYEIDPTNHEEAGDPLRARLESGPVAQFPARLRVARADFQLETGVGIANGVDPNQTDPQVEISWSDDGGTNWSNPLYRKLGRQAKADTNISVFSTGMSTRHGRRWRLDISDPVYVSFLAGDQSAEPRR
jgi:hypothetical protein